MVIGIGGPAPPTPKLVGGALCRAEPSKPFWRQGLVVKLQSHIRRSPPAKAPSPGI